jgi:hypothetical protein
MGSFAADDTAGNEGDVDALDGDRGNGGESRYRPAGRPEDADFPVWAGVLSIRTQFMPAQPAPDMAVGIEFPKALAALGEELPDKDSEARFAQQ